jgi:hypothetical protein
MSSASRGLLAGWFDDAGLFPPAALTIAQALVGHARHRVSWYDELLACFVSTDGRLVKVDTCAARLGLLSLDLSVVVPEGLAALPAALTTLRRCPRLRLRTVELPVDATPIATAARAASTLAEHGVALYVELPTTQITETRIHQLRTHGMRLKLRGGGTSIHAFTPEDQLALTILHCAAEMLPFTSVSGVGRAVRHRDPVTLQQRHGFLNIALATLTALRTGSHAAVRDALAERDRQTVAHDMLTLTARDVVAVRSLFTRVGSSHLAETVTDLTTLGIITDNY